MLEKIICAAVWYDDNIKYPGQPTNLETGFVILCYRHFDFAGWSKKYVNNDKSFLSIQWEKNRTSGFITNKHRFVDRKEAYKIFHNTDQDGCLTSEDLY